MKGIPSRLFGYRPPRHAGALLGLCALILAALGVGSGCTEGGATHGGDSADAEATSARAEHVMIIGVDGATWRVVDPLLAQGRMPHLADLIDRGARGSLETLRPAKSPPVWTTVATGVSPEEHGIEGFWHEPSEEDQEAGERGADEQALLDRLEAIGYLDQGEEPGEGRRSSKVVYESSKRRAPALWDMATRRGDSVDVLGWWTTYPAEEINGRMVSDRFIYNRFELAAEVRGQRYDMSGNQTHPPELAERLAPLAMDPTDVTPEQMGRFVNGEVRIDDDLKLHDALDELRIAYAKDVTFQRVAEELLAEHVPDLFLVYYQGVDIVSHYFWKHRFPVEWTQMYPDAPIPREELKAYENVVDEYHEFFDEQLGAMLEYADEDTAVIVLSDHGFVTGRREHARFGASKTVSGVHSRAAPPGIIVMAGAGVREKISLVGATVYDVAPTVLELMGYEIPPEMRGRVLEEALAEAPR